MSRKTNVAVYGAGYLGRQVLHHLKAHCSDRLRVVGFVDDTLGVGETVVPGLEVLGSLAEASGKPELSPGRLSMVFAIGYSDMAGRRRALQRVIDAGYDLFEYIHPAAMVEPGAVVGTGSIVLAGAILDQGVTLGPGCYVDIGVRLGADTTAGTNNYFCSGACTGSRVVIGDDCFLGMNCTITTDVRLGSNLFVNANSLVPRDMGDDVKFVEVRRSKELPQPPP